MTGSAWSRGVRAGTLFDLCSEGHPLFGENIPGYTTGCRPCINAKRRAETESKRNQPVQQDELDRFFTKVDVGDCWLWTGAIDRGYGKFFTAGRTRRAHRWLYEALVGPLDPDLTLDHMCRVRACVNPDHLDPVPQRVNLMRGATPSMRKHLGRLPREVAA